MRGYGFGCLMVLSRGALQLAAGLAILQPAHAVTIDPDRRAPTNLSPAAGRVQCGTGQGAAQLVGGGQVIITASHVLHGSGGLRAAPGNCRFEAIIKGQHVSAEIDVTQIVAGTTTPYVHPASYDWAVARLATPISGLRPFSLGGGGQLGQNVTMVSGRTLSRSGMAMAEACSIRSTRQGEGGREIMLDCSGEAGDSGAAILDRSGALIGIYVGFRSASPGSALPYSETHYNFALPINGAMRAAIRSLSR